MALKNFRVTNGINVDSNPIPTSVIQKTITSNSATTVDTIALNSFISCEYTIALVQGSKVRTSKVFIQTDGSSVDYAEFGITETGGTMSGVAISATTASTNAILQVTVTDAASTLVRYKIVKNIISSISYVPDAPTIGTATGGLGQASVAFTAPTDNGGATISFYTITSSPGFITGSGSSSPITVTGLTGGTSYTFTVTATNANGTSVSSSASNSVTPSSPPLPSAFFAGGQDSNYISGIDKIAFSGDTKSTLSATLSTASYFGAGAANSGTAAYFADGFYKYGPLSSIDKITFSDDTRSTLSATLSTARYALAGAANSGTAAYFAGGYDSNFISGIDKIAFSGDTKSTLSATLSTARSGLTGAANSGTAAYFAGGNDNSGSISGIDKITFSGDTKSTLSATLSTARAFLAGAANSGTAAYFAGGQGSSGNISGIDKITFSGDTQSTLAATLSTARNGLAGAANSGAI